MVENDRSSSILKNQFDCTEGKELSIVESIDNHSYMDDSKSRSASPKINEK